MKLRRSNLNRLLLAALLMCLPLWLRAPQACADTAYLDRILADWRRRQDAAHRVRYILDGKQLILKGEIEAEPPIPDRDMAYPARLSYWLDFDGNCARIERRKTLFNRHSGGDRFVPMTFIWMFNNSEFQRYTPRSENTEFYARAFKYEPDLKLLTKAGAGGFLRRSDHPVFFAHGAFRKVDEPWQQTHRLRCPLNSSMFRERGTAVRDGRQCVVVRSAASADGSRRFKEYWVDTRRDSAVLRYAYFRADKEVYRIDMWYDDSQDGWPLKRFELARHVQGELVKVSEFEVVECETDPVLHASLFHQELQPGLIVSDQKTDRMHRVAEPGEADVDVIELYRADELGSWFSARYLALYANVVALIVVTAYVIRRRKKRGLRDV